MKPPVTHFMYAKVHPSGHVWIESLAYTREWALAWPHDHRDHEDFGTEVQVFEVTVAPAADQVAAETLLTGTSKMRRQEQRGLVKPSPGDGCARRRGYPTREVAEAASRVRRPSRTEFVAKACHLCFQWHLWPSWMYPESASRPAGD